MHMHGSGTTYIKVLHDVQMLAWAQLFCLSLHAGQRRCRPHIHLAGITKKPVRRYTTTERRRSLKLAVALLPASGKVVVKAVSGTTWSGYKSQQQYKTKSGKDACKLSAEEYAEFIGTVLRQANRAVGKYPGQLILVHDRDPVHNTVEVRHLLQAKGVLLMTLPPRSPDLISKP